MLFGFDCGALPDNYVMHLLTENIKTKFRISRMLMTVTTTGRPVDTIFHINPLS